MLFRHIFDLVTSALKIGAACSCHMPGQQNLKEVHTESFVFSFHIQHCKNYTGRTVVATVAQWLRCCATNQKVAGSIPDGVIGIFQ